MANVKTNIPSRFGKKVQFDTLVVQFNEEGVAEVSDEQSETLISEFGLESTEDQFGEVETAFNQEVYDALAGMQYDELVDLAKINKIAKKIYSQYSTVESLANFLQAKISM
jgi:hypothetical protein